ncbi:MAG: glycosyltransferase family 39 protein [Candidatus Solibacter usitatus]|nr:glycosyltransferase family 39 protein [Candidatus Solibacter usitatus]
MSPAGSLPSTSGSLRSPALALILLLGALSASYLYGLGGVGLLGPDEPRYASIAREMARSGDWITPRLWGEPWFEKPPLLYWLTALGRLAGLDDHWAPRVPIALLSVLFLAAYLLLLRRIESPRTAWIATLILSTTAGWSAYSQIGVTDLPLAATFNAALLLALLWLETGSRPAILGAGLCFGLAILAKGLVPFVLVLPLLWLVRRRWRELVLPAIAAAAVAVPWYAALLALHGRAFFGEFFLRHHLARFSSGETLHAQPFWFYLPVLLGALFPWPAALALLSRRALLSPAMRILAATALFGFVFFSVAAGKLPGYILPLLPPLCALLARALDSAPRAGRTLALSAFLLGLCPVIAGILPDSLLFGLRRASFEDVDLNFFALILPFAALAWWLDRTARRIHAVTLVAALAALGLLFVKFSAGPALDQAVSARGLWRKVAPRAQSTCVDSLHRAWRYGLNYYSVVPLPDCDGGNARFMLRQEPNSIPRLQPRP